MPLTSLKDQFDFPDDVVYLNTASFSPAFKSVEKAGIEAVKAKSRPDFYKASDLFDPVIELRKLFAKIIDEDDYNRVVTIPSVSYGMANVANNITLQKGDEIILVEEQFPSNVYIWKALAEKYDAKIITVKQPENSTNWNSDILNAISDKTAMIAIGQIHWVNGIQFNLKAIRKKTNQHNALLIIDGSQSIGALPFSIKDIQPDALVCAGYKWLFGPYGCAYAYYGSYFDNGKPIEENWSTRLNSEDFSKLTAYQSEYKSLANRYSVGQSGSFIYVKMQIAALNEILKIDAEELQDYCHSIFKDALIELNELGFYSTSPEIRAKHVFGIKIPRTADLEKLKSELKTSNIHVSFRGDYIRISCHLFNTKVHAEKLVKTIKTNNIMDEYIDIVDEKCRPTGETALKSEIHKNGWLHNTVHVWFYTLEGYILLQQRSHRKKILPLLWDISVAGHVDAGESIESAAIRETKEEIGLEIHPNDLRKIATHFHAGTYFNGAIKDNEFHHIYITELKVSLEDLVPDPNEVEALKLVSIEVFTDLIFNSSKNMHFVESNSDYYHYVAGEIYNQIAE